MITSNCFLKAQNQDSLFVTIPYENLVNANIEMEKSKLYKQQLDLAELQIDNYKKSIQFKDNVIYLQDIQISEYNKELQKLSDKIINQNNRIESIKTQRNILGGTSVILLILLLVL